MRTIFYSWQSDVSINRSFIRSALDAAIAELLNEAGVEEAARDLVADQDTQGLPGSPSVAEAILTKIRSAYAFVADLTFVAERATGGKVPNPNVMIEYGYALHSLSDGRIIGVFNEAFGDPSELPFDLAHKRWPIRFRLAADRADQAKEKSQLVGALKAAISSIVAQFGDPSPSTSVSEFEPAAASDGRGMLRGPNEELAVTSEGKRVNYQHDKPYLFARVIPSTPTRQLSNVEALRLAQRFLGPMDRGRSGGNSARHVSGAVIYTTIKGNEQSAYAATELFLTGELWGWDTYYLDRSSERSETPDFNFVPSGAVERVYVDTVTAYLEFAHEPLSLTLPVKVQVGMVGVAGYRLAVSRDYFADQFVGPILSPAILYSAEVSSWDVDVPTLLKPFFSDIYDQAGAIRPDV